MNTSFDLVVIGHGAAGLSAAVTYLESADADAHVAVLERSTREQRGGATRWTGAFLRIDNEHNFDDTYSDRLTETSGGRADLDYLHILHKDTPAAITFLQDRGVEISFNEFPFPHTFVSGQPSMSAPASPIGGGASIVARPLRPAIRRGSGIGASRSCHRSTTRAIQPVDRTQKQGARTGLASQSSCGT